MAMMRRIPFDSIKDTPTPCFHAAFQPPSDERYLQPPLDKRDRLCIMVYRRSTGRYLFLIKKWRNCSCDALDMKGFSNDSALYSAWDSQISAAKRGGFLDCIEASGTTAEQIVVILKRLPYMTQLVYYTTNGQGVNGWRPVQRLSDYMFL